MMKKERKKEKSFKKSPWKEITAKSFHVPLNGQSFVGLREISASCSSLVYCSTRSVLVKSWNDSIICLIPYWTIPVRIKACEIANPTFELELLSWLMTTKLKQTQATKAHDTQSNQSPKAVIKHRTCSIKGKVRERVKLEKSYGSESFSHFFCLCNFSMLVINCFTTPTCIDAHQCLPYTRMYVLKIIELKGQPLVRFTGPNCWNAGECCWHLTEHRTFSCWVERLSVKWDERKSLMKCLWYENCLTFRGTVH